VAFQLYIKRTHRELRAQLAKHANSLKAFGISSRQVELLQHFKGAQRTGDLGLKAEEIESLIVSGYLRRDPQRGLTEMRTLEQTIERCLKTALRFDLAGRSNDADRCRGRARRLQNRIDVIGLVVAARGKKLARDIPPIDSD
jgi:hypothetical protein